MTCKSSKGGAIIYPTVHNHDNTVRNTRTLVVERGGWWEEKRPMCCFTKTRLTSAKYIYIYIYIYIYPLPPWTMSVSIQFNVYVSCPLCLHGICQSLYSLMCFAGSCCLHETCQSVYSLMCLFQVLCQHGPYQSLYSLMCMFRVLSAFMEHVSLYIV